ncbi:hypothetical protein D3C71_1918050 [compost metagenome]
MGEHIFDKGALFIFLPIGVAQQHPIAVFFSRQINLASQGRKAGVDDRGNQQTDHPGMPGFQLLRHSVGLIVQFTHHLFDTHPGFRAHLITAPI